MRDLHEASRSHEIEEQIKSGKIKAESRTIEQIDNALLDWVKNEYIDAGLAKDNEKMAELLQWETAIKSGDVEQVQHILMLWQERELLKENPDLELLTQLNRDSEFLDSLAGKNRAEQRARNKLSEKVVREHEEVQNEAMKGVISDDNEESRSESRDAFSEIDETEREITEVQSNLKLIRELSDRLVKKLDSDLKVACFPDQDGIAAHFFFQSDPKINFRLSYGKGSNLQIFENSLEAMYYLKKREKEKKSLEIRDEYWPIVQHALEFLATNHPDLEATRHGTTLNFYWKKNPNIVFSFDMASEAYADFKTVDEYIESCYKSLVLESENE